MTDAERETYPNLRALLDGRCGPISQWPGVEAEVREALAESERLRVAVRLNSEQASEEMDKIEAALAECEHGHNRYAEQGRKFDVRGFIDATVKALKGEKP